MKSVELRGLEPLTPSLPVRWTNCLYQRKQGTRMSYGAVVCSWLRLTTIDCTSLLQICSSYISVNYVAVPWPAGFTP
jgi:hypothetical protein